MVVKFGVPDGDQIPRRSEMTRCANCDIRTERRRQLKLPCRMLSSVIDSAESCAGDVTPRTFGNSA